MTTKDYTWCYVQRYSITNKMKKCDISGKRNRNDIATVMNGKNYNLFGYINVMLDYDHEYRTKWFSFSMHKNTNTWKCGE